MTNMKNKQLLIFFLSITIFNCSSGTFENDPNTWAKVFNQKKPGNVEILNSRFWKSAHWSYEYEVFIEFKASKEFIDDYFIKYDSLISPDEDNYHLLDDFFFDKPKWFQPKEYKDYQIWISNDKWNDTKLFINKNSGVVYFHHSQT